MLEISYSRAINEALRQAMDSDPAVVLLGQDIGVYGGAFAVTRGLIETFGPERIVDTPISEAATVGMLLGMALKGLRPAIELQFADFIFIAMDEIVNKLGKWRYMHNYRAPLCAVIRAPMGLIPGVGAEHVQCPEAFFMHVPGLKIAVPATPYDAKGLLLSALRGNDPVLYFEHKGMYRVKGPVPEEAYTVPFGVAEVRRSGTDVTIVATSAMVSKALAAAETLAPQGIEAEVIDPRTLAPLDSETILRSVRKTGRLVIVHENTLTAGPGAEIAALVVEGAFDALLGPIRRVTAPDAPAPASRALDTYYVPDEAAIVAGVLAAIKD
jgi:acetoin:2,6-dichlorophenolindophenol oxidoreductase subunit beta